VSNETKKISRDVSLLFSLDAIGGGFVLQSLIAYWFKVRYGISLSSLGGIFAIVDVIIGASIVATPYIAKRLGLVKTMVYSHLPSNVFLILIPLIPNLWASLTFLFLRYSLSQMDVPTRQSYLNSIVPPEERSYVVGISNASRSIAQSTTPYISSSLISAAASPIPFIGGGTLKIIYDILLYLRFRGLKEKY
jgi:MFS family permease